MYNTYKGKLEMGASGEAKYILDYYLGHSGANGGKSNSKIVTILTPKNKVQSDSGRSPELAAPTRF